MLSYYKPQLEKVASALSTATFMMVPFFYAFLQAGWVFRYILYPLVFVAPWVMMALKHDVYTMHVIYKTAPIAGFVILLICLRSIFNRRAGKPLDNLNQLLPASEVLRIDSNEFDNPDRSISIEIRLSHSILVSVPSA